LFYLPLAKQAALLKDDLLQPVDQLLDDPLLVDLVRDCLAGRHPASRRTGSAGHRPRAPCNHDANHRDRHCWIPNSFRTPGLLPSLEFPTHSVIRTFAFELPDWRTQLQRAFSTGYGLNRL